MNERQRAGAERHLDGTARPRAFILTGALPVVCRDPIYIDDLRRRDLKVLVITATAWHAVCGGASRRSRPPRLRDRGGRLRRRIGRERGLLPSRSHRARRTLAGEVRRGRHLRGWGDAGRADRPGRRLLRPPVPGVAGGARLPEQVPPALVSARSQPGIRADPTRGARVRGPTGPSGSPRWSSRPRGTRARVSARCTTARS